MFDTIKSALSKSASGPNTKYKEIMRLEPGNTYTLRLVPNVEDPGKTFFNYFSHSWESFATGQFVTTVSPQTFGEPDPIAQVKFSLMKHGSREEKAKAEKILRRENWLANVYVVSDPKNPDNNGKVKLLRFGRQLHKIIVEAIEGEDAEDFGPKIFDLSSNGCNFKIKVERQGEYPTYVSSRFAPSSKISEMTDDKLEEVYENAHDLETVFTVRSTEEMKKMLDEHFFCKQSSTVEDVWNTEPAAAEPVAVESTSKKKETVPSTSDESDIDPLDDDKVKELLDGLGD
jgi:hypothetical protein